MIDLNTFTIKQVDCTGNWSDLVLYATDAHVDKIVSVARIAFATGALGAYPTSTKDRASRNLDKFKQYLIDNDIKTESDWTNKASAKARGCFAECFMSERPYFSY